MRYIAKEGIVFIVSAIILSAVSFLLYLRQENIYAKYALLVFSAFFFIFCVFSIYFFRDPERAPEPGFSDNALVSPADGRVIFFGKVFDDRFLNKEVLKISIFMSIFNVHVNRIPLSGTVEKIIYNKGKFFSANLDKASIENEFNCIILSPGGGSPAESGRIAFVQIAGLIARRIVCRLKKGDAVNTGERFGLIKFGSRLDLYLPLGSEIKIKPGDRVFSGKTILGTIK